MWQMRHIRVNGSNAIFFIQNSAGAQISFATRLSCYFFVMLGMETALV